MADREGFEPSVTSLLHTLSKRAHSTTLTSALIFPGGGARSKQKFYSLGNHFRKFFSPRQIVAQCDILTRQVVTLLSGEKFQIPVNA
jgi:hypothetical protein